MDVEYAHGSRAESGLGKFAPNILRLFIKDQ